MLHNVLVYSSNTTVVPIIRQVLSQVKLEMPRDKARTLSWPRVIRAEQCGEREGTTSQPGITTGGGEHSNKESHRVQSGVTCESFQKEKIFG